MDLREMRRRCRKAPMAAPGKKMGEWCGYVLDGECLVYGRRVAQCFDCAFY